MGMDKPLALLLKAYTLEQIAVAAGVTKQAVSQWTKVPAERLPSLAKNLNKTHTELRPDLYPDTIKSLTNP